MKKSELKKIIRKEILSEYIKKEPDIESAKDKKEQKKLIKQWQTYQNQFSDIIKLLTDRSGYWYVWKNEKELIDKLKQLNPDQYQDFRNQVTKLMKQSRTAEKTMNAVKKEANRLIGILDK